jgi:hypothetical protein
MQPSFLRFIQAQEEDEISFKQWATIVEDAKQVFSYDKNLRSEESYLLDVEPGDLSNPSAGEIYDLYGHVVAMGLQIGIPEIPILTENVSWAEFLPPTYASKNFFRIDHDSRFGGMLEFTLITDSQQTLEAVINRFAIDSFNQGKKQFRIENSEYTHVSGLGGQYYEEGNFQC